MAQSSGSDMSQNLYVFGAGNVVEAHGHFGTNAALDPSIATVIIGPGWSVKWIATGRYRVIFKKRYRGHAGFLAQLRKNTPDTNEAKLGPVVLSDSNHGGVTTAEIFTFVSGVAANIAAAAGTEIEFQIKLFSGKRTPLRG